MNISVSLSVSVLAHASGWFRGVCKLLGRAVEVFQDRVFYNGGKKYEKRNDGWWVGASE
jgi:hypothetical protein